MSEFVGDFPKCDIPNGITVDQIQNALAKVNKNDELKLTNWLIERINQDGDNFCSNIYSVNVKYIKNSIETTQYEEHLLLKIVHPEVAGFGSDEPVMYEKILPEMTKILNTVKNATQLKLSPNCLYVHTADTEVYLLENLNALGYKTANRCQGLDVQHARLLLAKIAKFHAAGMVLQKQQPELIAKLRPSSYANCSENHMSKTLLYDSTEYVANLISSWPGYEEIARKMQRQLPHYFKIMEKLVNTANSKFNVLTHADLWTNNALFSYDAADKPSDVIFVDFQNNFWGTPAVDLHYFLHTSLKLEVLQKEHAALLQYYYDKLQETLYHLDQIDLLPTLEIYLQELKRCEFYAYYAAVCEMPICYMDKKTSENFNANTFGNQEALAKKRELLYANKTVETFLRYILKEFDALGVLDLI